MKLFKQRRKLIVNREVQYDVIMYVSLLVVAIFACQGIAALFFLQWARPLASNMTALEFIEHFKISFFIYQLIPVTFGLALGIYLFNRLTSRIAGPLFNLKRVVRAFQAAPSAQAEIKLRQDDYFQDEIKDINLILKQRSK